MNTKMQAQPNTATALVAYTSEHYNVLTLPQVALSQGDWQLAITIMQIDPKDTEMVYPTPGRSGRLSLHASAIANIAMCAGVQFAATHVEYDQDRSPTASVLARMQVAPATWISASGTYKLDIPARLEELKIAAEAKTGDERTRAIAELPALQVRTRRFAVPLAETGARSRSLRVLLSLKSSYAREDLAKPFAIPRLHFNPQSDTMKRAMSAYASNMCAAMFGDVVDEKALAGSREVLESAGAIEPPPPSAPQPSQEIRIEATQGELEYPND